MMTTERWDIDLSLKVQTLTTEFLKEDINQVGKGQWIDLFPSNLGHWFNNKNNHV